MFWKVKKFQVWVDILRREQKFTEGGGGRTVSPPIGRGVNWKGLFTFKLVDMLLVLLMESMKLPSVQTVEISSPANPHSVCCIIRKVCVDVCPFGITDNKFCGQYHIICEQYRISCGQCHTRVRTIPHNLQTGAKNAANVCGKCHKRVRTRPQTGAENAANGCGQGRKRVWTMPQTGADKTANGCGKCRERVRTRPQPGAENAANGCRQCRKRVRTRPQTGAENAVNSY